MKIKELETKLTSFKAKECENCREKESQLKNLNSNFEFEIKEKKKLEEKNKNLISSTKFLNSKIFQLFKEEQAIKQSYTNLIEKLNNFYSPLPALSASSITSITSITSMSNLKQEVISSKEKN